MCATVRLTVPSSGHAPAGFARFRTPLMSNVRLPQRRHSTHMPSLLSPKTPRKSGSATAKRGASAPAFTRIELRRGPCLGRCPVYQLTLHQDGRANFEGIAYVERIGRFEGWLSPTLFAKLCKLIVQLKVTSLQSIYSTGATDRPSTVVLLEHANSANTTTIRDEGDIGPIKLWAAQQAIDNMAQHAVWHPLGAPDA